MHGQQNVIICIKSAGIKVNIAVGRTCLRVFQTLTKLRITVVRSWKAATIFTFLAGCSKQMMKWLQCRLVLRGYPVLISAGLPWGSSIPGESFGCA